MAYGKQGQFVRTLFRGISLGLSQHERSVQMSTDPFFPQVAQSVVKGVRRVQRLMASRNPRVGEIKLGEDRRPQHRA